MNHRIAARLRELWVAHHGAQDLPALVEAGALVANTFLPFEMDSSDQAKLLSTGLATIAAIAKNVEGPVPDAVFEAVGYSLDGVYGLGVRRGMGEAYRDAGKRKHARRYIDKVTGETLPDPRRMRDLEQRALQAKPGKQPVSPAT